MTPPSRNLDEFLDALGGDVRIDGLERPGALSVTEVLATRDWFEKRRALSVDVKETRLDMTGN